MTRNMLWKTVTFGCLILAGIAGPQFALAADKPNIVYILADDLGYGDLKCLNPQGKIATPELDKLAGQGMIFTDAHTSSSVCTPTRYGVMTGRYNWRTTLQSGVLWGFSDRLIEADRLTTPAFLKQNGYHTACVGKWHLGMRFAMKDAGGDRGRLQQAKSDGWLVDYTQAIQDGPNAVGFDYYYGISASLDMPPYVWIENDRVQGLPTVDKTWIRTGPAHADFEAVDVTPGLTAKAVQYIGGRAEEARQGKPFFLYMPLNSPHTPIVPSKAWQGRSGLNAYADFVMQVDDCVGQVLKALDDHKLADNTLVVFTSDNGCSPQANYPELLAQGHNPSHVFRGHKADIFEGGHRVPFLVRWPGKVQAGSTSDQTVCLVDLLATCADVLDAELPATAGEDSVSILPALQGTAATPLREATVHHSINGSFAIRQGSWKLCLCPDSGGWSSPKPGTPASRDLPAVQLFDLSTDVGEQRNVAADHPERVAQLTQLLERYISTGRSTPGAAQRNAVPIVLHKPRPASKAAPKGKAAGKGKGKAAGSS